MLTLDFLAVHKRHNSNTRLYPSASKDKLHTTIDILQKLSSPHYTQSVDILFSNSKGSKLFTFSLLSADWQCTAADP